MSNLNEQFRMVDRCRMPEEDKRWFRKIVSENYPIQYMSDGDNIGFDFPDDDLYVKMDHDYKIKISYFGDDDKRKKFMEKILQLIDREFPQKEVS